MGYTRKVALSLTALGLLALPVHAAGQQQQTEPMGLLHHERGARERR